MQTHLHPSEACETTDPGSESGPRSESDPRSESGPTFLIPDNGLTFELKTDPGPDSDPGSVVSQASEGCKCVCISELEMLDQRKKQG